MNLSHRDGLSPEQHESVNRISESLKDLNHEECSSKSNIIRWLRSRNWNEQEAGKMLRNHILWRRDRGVDTILSWYQTPEVIDKYFPGGICGADKHGRPLFIAPVGRFDPKTFLKAVSRTEFLQSRIYQMEQILRTILPEASQKSGQEIDQLAVIMDMQGLGFKHMSPSWLSIMTESVTMIESNYPEVLGNCYVINAPPLFSRLYNFIKPLLSKATQGKIHILDSNYTETLLLHCSPESLPAVYGGTLTDPDGDPHCSSQICWSGPVPESYFNQGKSSTSQALGNFSISRSSSAQSFSASDKFITVDVGRGGQRDIPVGFLPIGVELEWCVLCELHDIGVGWFVQPSNTGPSILTRCSSQTSMIRPSTSVTPPRRHSRKRSDESDDLPSMINESLWEVLPIQRITTPISPFKGHHKIRLSGSYYMRLDNSYSWMRPKRIQYAVKITLPKDTLEAPSLRNLPSQHSTEAVSQVNANSVQAPAHGDTRVPSTKEIGIFPIPLANPSQSLLVTGGSMDVNISLLFRLLAQLLLVPKFSSEQPTG